MQRVVVRALIVLACVAATSTACSTTGPADDPSTAPVPSAGASSSTPAPTGRTDLTITYRSSPEAEPQTWTLTCRPTGGTVDDPAQACDALAENGEAMAPTAPGTVCTQVFGGTDVATVSGTWGGVAYDGRFSRQNGCEISRWDALVGLLPVGGTR